MAEADRLLWEALRWQGSPFHDRGALAHLRETSAKRYAQAYGRWLAWLQQADPMALTDPPLERLSEPRLRDWVAALNCLRPSSRLMQLAGALRVFMAAAPEADWSAHRRIKQGLERSAGRGDPARKAGRILSARVLLQAGVRHAGPDADAASTALQRAVRQRDGTLVAMLAMMPMRHRALSELRIGHSILIMGETLKLVLHEDLTKTGVPWGADVPEPAAGLLWRYLRETRPFLMSRREYRHDALWVGNAGVPMSYSYIGRRIPDITRRLTGVNIPPHFFRDAAATPLVRTSPQAARVIAPVLGHADHRTAERHYIQAGSIEAGRDYADMLRWLRRQR